MKKLATAASILFAASIPFSAMAAYTVTAVSNGGSVSGKVTFSGKDPAPVPYTVSKDTDTCGTKNRNIDFVKVNKGALQEVVVFLDKVKEGKDWSKMVENIVLDQKGCEFSPYINIMRNNDKLKVTNSDPVMHNIHTYEIIGKAKKTGFNVSQPPELKEINKTVKLRRGAGLKLECDAHDFMHGFMFVAKSPYYAKVGADGSFTITDIPAGDYTIKTWHGTLGEKKGTVSVSAGGKATVDFKY